MALEWFQYPVPGSAGNAVWLAWLYSHICTANNAGMGEGVTGGKPPMFTLPDIHCVRLTTTIPDRWLLVIPAGRLCFVAHYPRI